MGGGRLSALFLSWAAYHPEELSMASIAADDYATASDSPAYPGSLDEPAGRLCKWETAQASEPDGWNLPAAPGWNALICNPRLVFAGLRQVRVRGPRQLCRPRHPDGGLLCLASVIPWPPGGIT